MSRSPSGRRGDSDAPPPNLRETVEIVPRRTLDAAPRRGSNGSHPNVKLARRRVDLDQVIALQVRTAPDRAIPTNVSGGCVSLSRRRPDV